MTATELAIFLFVATSVVWLANQFLARKSRPKRGPVWPKQLQGAVDIAVERTFQMKAPIYLTGRPDKVIETPAGEIFIIDLKTRRSHKVIESDRLQLSAYAMLVRRSKLAEHKTVSPVGYIRFETPKGVSMAAVELMSEDDVIRLYDRYWQILDETIAPLTNGSHQLCRHCGHKDRCPSPI